MIQDIDATLKELLVQKVPLDASVDVKFEMPNKDWSASVTKPTVNCFLYDVRENHELRSMQRSVAIDAGAGTESRAPVRVDLCYLVTAWTSDISDEHQLLGRVLTALLKFPVVPTEMLQGGLVTQPFPLRAWIAQPERIPNPWEFWGHMEHGMKASLHVVLTASIEPHPTVPVEIVTQKNISIKTLDS